MVKRLLTWLNNHRPQVAAAVFWLIVILAVRQYMSVNDLTISETVRDLRELLVGEWYGPLIYVLVYLLRPLVLFPASWLTVLAGNIFGLGLGFVYALIAGMLSAVFPYFVGRWFAVDAKDEAKESGIWRFVGTMRRNPFQSVLTMRLLYLPYDAVSLLAGSLKISFITFALATALGNIGGTLVYVGIGASIEGDITSSAIEFNPLALVLSAVILVISLGLSRYLRRRQEMQQDEPQQDIIEASVRQ